MTDSLNKEIERTLIGPLREDLFNGAYKIRVKERIIDLRLIEIRRLLDRQINHLRNMVLSSQAIVGEFALELRVRRG